MSPAAAVRAPGPRRTAPLSLLLIGALVLAACSSDPAVLQPDEGPETLAEEMIVGELATTIGLGPLLPSCSDPGPLAVGTTFGCSATTEPGEVIQVSGVVNPDGHLALTTTNLISAAAIPSFEREVAAALNNSVGSNFTAESVDCGPTAVVLPADFVLGCALVMPASGEIVDVSLTITDLDQRSFGLLVGDQPRSGAEE